MVARSRWVGVSIAFGLAAACAAPSPMALRPSSGQLQSAKSIAPVGAAATPPAPGTAAAVGAPMDLLESLAPAARCSCRAANAREAVARLFEAMSTPHGRLDDVLAAVRCSPSR